MWVILYLEERIILNGGAEAEVLLLREGFSENTGRQEGKTALLDAHDTEKHSCI